MNNKAYFMMYLGGSEMNEWFYFRSPNKKKIRIITDKGPKHAWEIYSISKDYHLNPYYVYDKTVKAVEDEKTTKKMTIDREIKDIKRKEGQRKMAGHFLVCPECGGHMGKDRFCWECDNNR